MEGIAILTVQTSLFSTSRRLFFLIALLGESNTMSMPSSYHAKTHQPLKIF